MLFGSKVLRCLVAILLVLDIFSAGHYVRAINLNDKAVGQFDQGIGPFEGEPSVLRQRPAPASRRIL